MFTQMVVTQSAQGYPLVCLYNSAREAYVHRRYGDRDSDQRLVRVYQNLALRLLSAKFWLKPLKPLQKLRKL